MNTTCSTSGQDFTTNTTEISKHTSYRTCNSCGKSISSRTDKTGSKLTRTHKGVDTHENACDAYVVNTRSSKYCKLNDGHSGGHKWQAER